MLHTRIPSKEIFSLFIIIFLQIKIDAFVDQLLIPPGEQLMTARQWSTQVSYDLISGKNFVQELLVPVISYNWTNKIGAMIVFPYFLKIKNGFDKSSGISDIGILGNFELYHHETFCILGQGGLFVPSGAPNKQPNTGLGGYSPFLSVDGYHLKKDWYTQCITTLLIPGKGPNIHFGPQFLFNIATGPVLNTSKGSNFYLLGELVFVNVHPPTRKIVPINTGDAIFLTLRNVGGLAGLTGLFLGGSISWQKGNSFLEILIQAPISQRLIGAQPKFLINTTISASMAF